MSTLPPACCSAHKFYNPWCKDCKAADWKKARAIGVSRMFDNKKALLLSLDREPTDDDLRRIHEALR
jgi:hypothetical protein